MKTLLSTTAICLLTVSAYANANAATKIYVCATAQNVDLAQVDYEALSWVEIKSIGNFGETGKKTNVLNYDTWDTKVTQKAKGITDAGSPELEVARIPTDPGQIILRTAAAIGNNNNYAFKMVRPDGIGAGVGTVRYNRGLVMGPSQPNGRNEDFDLEVFTLGFQQEEVVVNPLAGGVPPSNTVAPAITGTAQVGQVLTSSTGTFTGDATITYTYQWFAAGVAIPGATASTYTAVAGDVGKKIASRVTGTNASGNAIGVSPLTAAVVV